MASAQERRRARRAEARAAVNTLAVSAEQTLEFAALLADAQGATDLPLGVRDEKWDSGEALKSYDLPADADAFMWKDPDGDPAVKGSYKLPFVSKDGGKHAVWGAITAIAGVLSGARGGADIPAADVAKIKTKIEGYYADAATKFKDPDIKVPWADDKAEAETEEFAPSDTTVCADGDCNHPAGMHGDTDDGDNMGACSAPGCDCDGFEMDDAASVSVVDELMSEITPLLAPDSELAARAALSTLLARYTLTFDAGMDVPLIDAHKPGSKIPKRHPSPRLPAVTRAVTRGDQAAQAQWTATLAPEGALTDDGRAFAPDSISWRDLPLTLMGLTGTSAEGGHDGAEVAGRIDNIWREGGLIKGSGVFDASDFGQEIARMVSDGTLRGISVDLAIHKYDFGPKSDWFDADGNYAPVEQDADAEAPSMIDLLFGDTSDEEMIFMVTDATLGMACHSADTEVLTDTGWKRFPEIKKGQKIATRNQLTKAIEYDEPFYFHQEQFDTPMLRFHNSRNLDLLVTPNHRMLVVKQNGDELLMPAHELAAAGKGTYGIPLVAGWHDTDVETFTIESELEEIAEGFCQCGCGTEVGRVRERWEGGGRGPGTITRFVHNHGHGANLEPLNFDATDFAAFMGAWIAEGCIVRNRPGMIYISQMPKSRGYEPYTELLERMFGKVHHDGRCFAIKNVRLWRYLEQFGKSHEKFVPSEIKQSSRRQIRAFFDHYMMGDGYAKQPMCSTVSKLLADDLQEIAQKLGMWASIRVKKDNKDTVMKDGRVIKAENKRPCYRLSFKNSAPGMKQSVRATWGWKVDEVPYSGMVYCVSVPNEVFYVRRNGLPAWSGNTACPFQAFREATIEPASSLVAAPHDALWTVTQQAAFTVTLKHAKPALTASATLTEIPVAPLVEWFANPELDAPAALTVTDDGRIYGHVAEWSIPHIAFPNAEIYAPHSKTDYAYYLLGEVACADGERVSVGNITLGTGHAAPNLGQSAAAAHYDHTGTVVADVACGEDEHGIWVAGALRSTVTDDVVRALRAAKLSGDWRNVEGNLELVAALAVNVPGFPIPRTRASVVASGETPQVVSLTAAGIVCGEACQAAFDALAMKANGDFDELAEAAAA